jgi:isocitrate dehydrogenase
MDVGGYYLPDHELASKAMRPSATLNAIIDELS